MPRNPSGIYSLTPGNPVVADTPIDPAWANTLLNDISAELTNSVDKQGRTAMNAPLKLADGSLTAPALTFNSDANSGIYRQGPDEWSLVAGGVELLRITTTQVRALQELQVGGINFRPNEYARLDGATFTGLVQSGNPKFRLIPSAAQTTTGSGFVLFDTAQYNVGGGILTPALRQWTVPTTGYYHLHMGIQWSFASGNSIAVELRVNGSNIGNIRTMIAPDTAARSDFLSTTLLLTVGQTITAHLAVSGGGDATVETAFGSTHLSGYLIP